MAKFLDQTGLSFVWNKIKSLFATKSEVSTLSNNFSEFKNTMGKPNGLASLDGTGKVPSSQLPSYVDDVLEYDNKSAFPRTGEAGKIYVSKNDNKTYRWGGTQYVEISASLAIGTITGTAYDGGKGNALEIKVNTLDGRIANNEEIIVEKLNKADTNYAIEGMPSGLKITTGSVEYTFEDDGTFSIGGEAVATYQDVIDNTTNKVDKNGGLYTITNNEEEFKISDAKTTSMFRMSSDAITFLVGTSKALSFNASNGELRRGPNEILDSSMFLSTSEIDELCQ